MLRVYYLDILFFINLAINYLVLFVTAKLSASFIKIVRLLFASLFGAVGCVIFFYINIPIVLLIVTQLVFYSVVVFIAFDRCNIPRYFKRFFIFLASNFTLAGGIFAVYFIFSPESIVTRNGTIYIDIPFQILLFWVFIAYIIISVAFFGLKGISDNNVKEIKIKILDKDIQTTGFHDTGKNLFDPLTNKPLIIIEKSLITDFISLEDLPEKLFPRMFPYRTVSGETQMFLGIRAENIIIGKENIGSAYIAVAETNLSDNNTYRALF